MRAGPGAASNGRPIRPRERRPTSRVLDGIVQKPQGPAACRPGARRSGDAFGVDQRAIRSEPGKQSRRCPTSRISPAPAQPSSHWVARDGAGCGAAPPSGEPIVLLCDHATMGGYPVVATVISADIGVIASSLQERPSSSDSGHGPRRRGSRHPGPPACTRPDRDLPDRPGHLKRHHQACDTRITLSGSIGRHEEFA